MKLALYFFFLLFLATNAFAQKDEYKVSSKDSLDVLKFWRLVVKALNAGDAKFIEKNSSAKVECYCGTDSVTDEITMWKATAFAPQFIKKYNISPKLKKVIETESPKIMLSPVNESKTQRIFSVVYVVDKPTKDYEGTSIFFDISKKDKSFKLKSIWTIP
jgi:hypothetical protein